MPTSAYLNLDLLVEPAATGYRARVLNSPVGQASHEFSLPFSPQDVGGFRQAVRDARHLTPAGADQPASSRQTSRQTLKQLGGRLYGSVFSGDVGTCLLRSIDEAHRQNAGLRVRLRLNDVPELASLPWEYLYDPSLNRFLCQDAKISLVRYLELPRGGAPVRVQPPLRILALVSLPSSLPRLDSQQEWNRLTGALDRLIQSRQVAVDLSPEATLAGLHRQLVSGSYHVFHYIGHGGMTENAGEGVLALRDEAGQARLVPGEDLAVVLASHGGLRLAVLNACEGARPATGDMFAGTAMRLVQQGIPAVVAMQAEVSDRAAIAFAESFYAALATGQPIDAAVTAGRLAIYTEPQRAEWGIPVLYMRADDGQLFEIESKPDSGQKRDGEPGGEVDLTRLRRLLTELFNLEDLQTLAFDLGIDWENIQGSTKPAKVIGLIEHCRHHGHLPELVEAVRRVRPGSL